MVKNRLTGKPRGYAFVEFEHEREMHAAVKGLNGKKIDGMRILTDIERGRTRPDWRPRRLGKGLGKNRQGPSEKPKVSSKHENGREPPSHGRSYGRATGYIREREFDRRKRSRSRSRSRDRDRRRSREFLVLFIVCSMPSRVYLAIVAVASSSSSVNKISRLDQYLA
ncbi:U1 small nuclear ribonucleoprotein 70kDa [Clonorchis sinensis]|uniref:U1 small nuclear ribonucleoprotein 70kDa n=1 Tax=Clonorchis sinensis TaxID=79923 RepID=G7Y4M6_CLOSI|nr:U1 small nuclear ribonucleoprotein 70kDa [Clonorchis sinensis]